MGFPYISKFTSKGYHTENAATIIQENFQGINGFTLVGLNIDYLAAATAHSLTFLEAIGAAGCRTTNSAVAAASQAHLITVDAPTDPAGNATASGDVIAYQLADGSWEFNTVSSLAVKDITLGTNIAVAVPAGAKVLIFGVAADRANQKISAAASVTTAIVNNSLPFFVAKYAGDPVVFQSSNGTNAGFLNRLVFGYIQ